MRDWGHGSCAVARGSRCSGSEAGSYSRLIDCAYHSTVGLRAIKKKKKVQGVTRCEDVRALICPEVSGFGSGLSVQGAWSSQGLGFGVQCAV